MIAKPSTCERAENALLDATGLPVRLSSTDPIFQGAPNPPSIKPIPSKQLEVSLMYGICLLNIHELKSKVKAYGINHFNFNS